MQSTLGKGSVFTLSIPIVHPKPIATEQAAGTRGPTGVADRAGDDQANGAVANGQATLLIVDDFQGEPRLSRPASREAVSGACGRRRQESNPDGPMRTARTFPDGSLASRSSMAGKQRAESRPTPAADPFPIVAVSAHATAQDRDEARAAGCDGFLAKPVDEKALLDMLRRYLGSPSRGGARWTSRPRSSSLMRTPPSATSSSRSSTRWAIGRWRRETAGRRVDRVAQDPPDLILLDVMMPVMDGFQACRLLKDDEDTRLIPIVIMTALHAVEDRIKGVEAGADDFLTKPVDDRELAARIRAALRMKHTIGRKLRQTEQVRDHYAKFVPEIVKRLVAANPEAPELGKREQDAAFVFVDISGYTALSERLAADLLSQLVEQLLLRLPRHDSRIWRGDQRHGGRWSADHLSSCRSHQPQRDGGEDRPLPDGRDGAARRTGPWSAGVGAHRNQLRARCRRIPPDSRGFGDAMGVFGRRLRRRTWGLGLPILPRRARS